MMRAGQENAQTLNQNSPHLGKFGFLNSLVFVTLLVEQMLWTTGT